MSGRWGDFSAGRPGATALLGAGITGVLRYAGTPGRAKNITAEEYHDLAARGIDIALVYEDVAGDAAGGRAAGVAHANAVIGDARGCGIPSTVPICAAADQHLTAAQVTAAVEYQAGFYATARAAGWTGPVGGYGFSEFITAIRSAAVADWFWVCGAWSQVPTWAHLYQRNGSGGPTADHVPTVVVAGVEVDINDLLLPLEDDVSWKDLIDNPLYDPTVTDPGDMRFHPSYSAEDWLRWANLKGDSAPERLLDMPVPRQGAGQSGVTSLRAVVANLDALIASLQDGEKAIAAAVSTQEAALLAAIKSVPGGDPVALAAAVAPALAALLPKATTPADFVAALGARLA